MLLSLSEGVYNPTTRINVALLGPCFKTGRWEWIISVENEQEKDSAEKATSTATTSSDHRETPSNQIKSEYSSIQSQSDPQCMNKEKTERVSQSAERYLSNRIVSEQALTLTSGSQSASKEMG
jgi:hypothetical protein